jgi:trigger factor
VVPKLDEELRGKRPGDILKFNDVLPDRFGDRAGEEVAFQVLVKDAKRKVLPDVDDDWVSEVSEFDTVDELRTDIRKRLELVGTFQAQMAARDKVLEAAAELVDVDIPDALVQQEMERRLHDLAHRLEAQGADIAQYLAATGQEQQAFVESVRQGAIGGVRADLALRAVVAQEGVEVSEDELAAEVARIAERMEEKPAKVRRDLDRRGLLEAVRSDLARAKALQVLVDRATVVDEEGNPLDLTLPESEESPDQDTQDQDPEDQDPEDQDPEEESPA